MNELLQATSLEEQRNRWEQIKESLVWRCALWLGSHPFVFRFALDNWGWYRQSLSSAEITSVVSSKFDNFMNRHLIRESHLAQLILQGAYTNRDALPLYLREDCYPIIQSQMERVKFLNCDLQAYLDQLEKKPLLKLSGSNVPAYLGADRQASLWKTLSHRIGVGSCVCFRGFLSPLQIDDEWQAVSETLDASELQDSDKYLIYDIYLAKKVS